MVLVLPGFEQQLRKPDELQAKLVFSHVGCARCSESIDRLHADDDFLLGFVKCTPVIQLGPRQHQARLKVAWQMSSDTAWPETVEEDFQLDFGLFPVISPAHAVHMPIQVQIDGAKHALSQDCMRSASTVGSSLACLTLNGPACIESKSVSCGSLSTEAAACSESSDAESLPFSSCEATVTEEQRLPLGQVAASQALLEKVRSRTVSNREKDLLKSIRSRVSYKVFYTSKIQAYSWYPCYKNRVFHHIDRWVEAGAARILLVGVKPKKENRITTQEIPALMESIWHAFDDKEKQTYPFYEGGKQRIDYQSISEIRMPLEDLVQSLPDLLRDRCSILVSCCDDDRDLAKELQKLHSAKMSFAVARADEDYSRR